jgi:alpha-N-arabinofuranosidase
MNEQAGLIIYRSHENHYLFLKGKSNLLLIKNFKGRKEEIASIPYSMDDVILEASVNNLGLLFRYGPTPDDMKNIGDLQSLEVIADGNGNQFNGPGIGMYATSNGIISKNSASFDWFRYIK